MAKKGGLGALLTGMAMGAAAVFFSKKENRDKTTKLAKKTALEAKKKSKEVEKELKKLSTEAKRKSKKIKAEVKKNTKKIKRISKPKK